MDIEKYVKINQWLFDLKANNQIEDYRIMSIDPTVVEIRPKTKEK